ncbi:type II toxin-antitoxin system HipA family toxin [Caulobacter segnis]|uniref:type II toxin-antitoxin system HipA family toxin n=1 Tax=Caulobacter segnis TaxID=88688 RepID=UPI0024105A39|nr:type II toxin-antitoxin system HipA family toxin [Caulobacter segnis]MDG2520414.1 type II toxin-antitoxin system HipA family toxin [Caulobacter segnis]
MTSSVPVWFGDLQVGDVTVEDDGSLGFEYAARWRATQGAFPISLTLPLTAGRFEAGAISPWLANLLPEERQLKVLTRTYGLDHADTLALLKEIGGDTAGALSFGAPSTRARWTYTPLTEFYGVDDPQAALERHFEDLRARPFLAGEEGVRVSLAGGQEKSALAVLDSNGVAVLRLPQDGDIIAIPRDGAPSTIILKPDNPILPGIVENETYCLRLAQAVGIESADVTILPAGARRAICVLRYDRRIGSEGGLRRVHQEDFAQANGVPPGRKYERGTLRGPDLKTLLGTGLNFSSADALSLLDQLIFNILVANTDAHAKNYSLLLPIGSGPRLSPLYDVSSVLPWPDVVQYFAQNIAGKKRKPGDVDARHWDAVARASNYRPGDTRTRVEELIDRLVANRVAVTEAVVNLPGCKPGYVDQVAALVEENALRIGGRLSARLRALDQAES